MRRLLLIALLPFLMIGGETHAQSIHAYAGGGNGDGRPAIALGVVPTSLAFDRDGHLFFVDAASRGVRRVDARTGIITTAAAGAFSSSIELGDGGPATLAAVPGTRDIAFDSEGNLYIASEFRIRRIDRLSGTISTYAGGGTERGDGVPATASFFETPTSLAFDASDNLYFVSGFTGAVVRRVARQTKLISTVAGNRTEGFSGDGGPATLAALGYIPTIRVDPRGHLILADTKNRRIREVTPDGIIRTIAGTGALAVSGDGGPAILAEISEPGALTLDGTGNIFFADVNTPDSDGSRIRSIDRTTGLIERVLSSIKNRFVIGLAFDGNGLLNTADFGLYLIRRLSDAGATTLAGNGNFGFDGDGGFATQARLDGTGGLAIDAIGRLFLVDRATFSIRVIDPVTRFISTFVGKGQKAPADGVLASEAYFNLSGALEIDGQGSLYFGSGCSLTQILPDGRLRILAGGIGNDSCGFGGDGGPATLAKMAVVGAIAFGPAGQIFITDTAGHRIRRIADGMITTVAGNGAKSPDGAFGTFSGDGGPATAAGLNRPHGIAVDANGALYIADRENYRVRKVTTDGTITTILGIGTAPGPGRIERPDDLAFDSEGKLVIAGGPVYRFANGVVTPVTNLDYSVPSPSGDDGPASAAQPAAYELAISRSDDLYFNDTRENRIRMIPKCRPVTAPMLLTPSDGSIRAEFNIALTWMAAAFADSYDLFLDTTDPPSKLVARDSRVTSQVVANLAGATTYYWRVVAKGDPYCTPLTTEKSAVRRFTTGSVCGQPSPPAN